MKTKYKLRLLFIIAIGFTGCEKFIDPGLPNSQLVSGAVFETDQSATAAITGIYASLIPNTTGSFLNYQITLYTGLMADELIAPGASNKEFYQNNLTPELASATSIWENGYKQIYRTNAVLEGLDKANQLTPALKTQLQGEALFMRALCHFYLLNLYGDIPYISTTDYPINAQVARTAVTAVYPLIIKDLESAAGLLSDTYVTTERGRPNKATALALLSRVFLYTKDWENARKTATELIQQRSVYQLANSLNQVFLKTSTETIWQLKSSIANYNTVDGYWFILKAAPTSSYLSPDLVKSFERNDLRKNAWVDSLTIGSAKWHYAAKYKVKSGANPTEHLVFFRLTEQYLIRAEAQIHLNNLSDAITDIDAIRLRAGLVLIKDSQPNIGADALLLLLERERKSEFFAEMGHRWFDLKRTNRANAVLSTIKAPNWQTADQLMPIPKSQMERDRNTVQNPGYLPQ